MATFAGEAGVSHVPIRAALLRDGTAGVPLRVMAHSGMTRDPRPDDRPGKAGSPVLAGGAPLALLIVLGVVVGGLFGQPSIGFLVGLALGVAVAIAIGLSRRG